MSSWICDGVPKDGKTYPNAMAHEPYENTGPDCIVCGLPQEAMAVGAKKAKARKTQYTNTSTAKPQWIIPVVIVGAIAIAAAAGYGAFRLISGSSNETETQTTTQTPTTTTTPTSSGGLISEQGTNGQYFSQGEKILLDKTAEKQAGADAFAQKNWEDAIASYQQAADKNPNDPEGKIYLNNATARKAGNPLPIAVAVPIAASPDSAKEILRGVARSQEEFNRSASGRLLEVLIVNDPGSSQTPSLAEDIINAADVLGVVGHGIDPGSQQALSKYQKAGLAVLSPMTLSVSDSSQSTIKTIPIGQKKGELLGDYLQAVSKTLTQYASKQYASPSVVVFYNSDSPYSEQLKDKLVDAIAEAKGKLVKEVDIKASGFDGKSEIADAQQSGAQVAFLALSKSQVAQALAIAQANATMSSPLMLMGGDELYNADLLVQGGDAIKGTVLAVPWSFQSNDSFSQDAIKSWKGRVSWRTATAYDATRALVQAIEKDPTRAGVSQSLNNGLTISGNTTNFNIFNEVPLVEAVSGTNGPPGSKYEFASVE
jgi:ABC-type branched-subunit amino acid transport system substrate-binding protein